MFWEDEGFIISKRKFKENAIILEVFTKLHGRTSAIVYGGTSKKIKNYLQLMNKVYVAYNSKNENRIGYFKIELIDAISPKYFGDKNKILGLNSLSSILKIVLPENQSYNKIYDSLDFLLGSFNKKSWICLYLNWELDLINDLGYGFEFNTEKNIKSNINKTFNIKIDNFDYVVPKFLLSKQIDNVELEDLYRGFNFCRNLMENKFFIPNNIKFPYSRKLLENKFLKVN